MASNKETPRQRMIGMMYLVLTALLALQVSSAVIDKFQALNKSLESSTSETNLWIGKKVERMEEEIKRRGNRSNEVAMIDKTKLIMKKSKEELEYLENLKKELIEKSGGIDEDGSLKGAKEETKVEEIMIGANKSGKGYELQGRLQEYVKFMNQASPINFSMLALDGKEDPLFEHNSEQRNKDFAELNFGQTPLVAGLAILSELQSRIASMQEASINTMAETIGITDFKFDVLKPVASPVARVVAAGTKYEAKVFMSATSSTLKPEIKVEGKDLTVDESGVGSLSFIANGGNYSSDGYAKKKWIGNIKMRKPDGTDTIYTIEEEYLVAKPVIQVRSASVQALYRNCGNKLNVQVPALGNAYNPAFTAEGATVIPGAEKGIVTVVPKGPTVKLKVSSNGSLLGEEKFNVMLIPSPTIEIKVNGRKVDPVKGIDKNDLRNVSVKAIADKDFARFLPDDSHYKVTEARVSLVANKKVTIQPKTFSNEYENIGSWRGEAKTNNYLLIEVLQVKRRNFRGEWEEVSHPDIIQLIPIN